MHGAVGRETRDGVRAPRESRVSARVPAAFQMAGSPDPRPAGPEAAASRAADPLPAAIFDSIPAGRYHGRGSADATMPTRPTGNGKRVMDAR